jgi:hypothetical protein
MLYGLVCEIKAVGVMGNVRGIVNGFVSEICFMHFVH